MAGVLYQNIGILSKNTFEILLKITIQILQEAL